MATVRVAVLGAGPAGLAAALHCARAGHQVTLIDQDSLDGAEDDPFAWERRGIPHFQQPHMFLGRGRKELAETLPDVLDAFFEAGAEMIGVGDKAPGPPDPDDALVGLLAIRRPVIEAIFRRFVRKEQNVRLVRSTATGYEGVAATQGKIARVTGVITTDGTINTDVIIDAMGRRTPSATWLKRLGVEPASERVSDCSIAYYSRYYRVKDGQRLPDGPWLFAPRGDLGYASFTAFPGDNNTFAALIAVPPADADLKQMRNATAFEAVVAELPLLRQWANPDLADPITDVLPMGGLRNRILESDEPEAAGLFRAGDALGHTDPVLALGLSMSLVHARAITAALAHSPTDLFEATSRYLTDTRFDLEERFAYATAVDDARLRRWLGEPIDIRRRDGGSHELFTLAGAAVAAMADRDIFNRVLRRNAFLSPLAELDQDAAMLDQIERILAGMPAPPPAGPNREHLVEIIRNAV